MLKIVSGGYIESQITMTDIIMRTIVDLPEKQAEHLSRLAEREKLSRAEVIRRAVAEYLRTHQPDERDEAFGLWRARGEDGLHCQERIRTERGDESAV